MKMYNDDYLEAIKVMLRISKELLEDAKKGQDDSEYLSATWWYQTGLADAYSFFADWLSMLHMDLDHFYSRGEK